MVIRRLLLAGACSFFIINQAHCLDSDKFKTKIEKLAAESKKGQSTCNTFLDELNSLTKSADSFKNKENVLNILSKLENNPGVPKATEEARVLLVQQLSSDKIDYAWFKKNADDMQNYCGVTEMFNNLIKIIDAKSTLALNKQELLRVKNLGLNFVDKESSYPSIMLSVGVSILILNKLNETEFFAEKKLPEAKIKKLQEEFQQLSRKIHKNKNQEAVFRMEIIDVNNVREKVRTLFVSVR
jgi:hypothetical protein